MAEKTIGTIETAPHGITQTEWRIPYYTSVVENRICNSYDSPTFSIAGFVWQLRISPKGYCRADCFELYLMSCFTNFYPISIEYYVGFRKTDGSMDQLIVTGTLKSNECWIRSPICSIKNSEFLQRKTELLSCDVLTITFTMVTKSSNCAQQNMLDQTKALKLIKLDKLSENFTTLFDDKESCDVTLKVKDTEYKAHRSVLIARSSVFAANFKHDTLDKRTGVITIPDCDPDSFVEFLQYLYSGKLEELSFRNCVNLYYISDKYDVQELKTFCIDYLKQCLTVENFCEVANFADNYDETALFSAAQDFFNKNINNILITSEWEGFLKNHSRLANKLLIAMPKVKYGE